MDLQVCITWVDQSLYVSPLDKYNAESGPSAVVSLQSETEITASISSLNPPTSKGDPIGYSEAYATSLNASGWNVYAGIKGAPLLLQNVIPIPIATKFYVVHVPPLTIGPAVGTGQYADHNHFLQRTAMRA